MHYHAIDRNKRNVCEQNYCFFQNLKELSWMCYTRFFSWTAWILAASNRTHVVKDRSIIWFKEQTAKSLRMYLLFTVSKGEKCTVNKSNVSSRIGEYSSKRVTVHFHGTFFIFCFRSIQTKNPPCKSHVTAHVPDFDTIRTRDMHCE